MSRKGKKSNLKRYICTLVFIAELVLIARTWKQLKYPSTEEWIKKIWCVYTVECYSAVKKNEIMPFFNNMGGPRDYHTK